MNAKQKAALCANTGTARRIISEALQVIRLHYTTFWRCLQCQWQKFPII